MMQQLSAQDAQFLYLQTANGLTHIMAVYVYDPSTSPGGRVRFKDIIAHVAERVHMSPVFKRKLYRLPFNIDHPYWVEDEHFDLEAHITHGRLPEPGDWRQFCIHIARHHSKPMDMNRPLWDMYVIEGLDGIPGFAKGSFAIATRIHHAAVDGGASAYFFAALGDKDPQGTPVIDIPSGSAQMGKIPEPAEILKRAVLSNLTSPIKLTKTLIKFAPALLGVAQKNFQERNTGVARGVPDTRFNHGVTPHRMFDAVTFQLADLKAMRLKVEGATINDVVLAICAGALRKYLIKHEELPDQSLVVAAPINARTESGQEKNPGNNISAMTVGIGTDIADPYERLQAVRNATKNTKAAKSGLSARLLTDLSQHIPGATMAAVSKLMTSERFSPKLANLYVSNMPGPQFPMYLAGAELTHQYGMAPLGQGAGLFMATPSYNGSISFNITSDRKVMPDVQFFRECIEAAFEEMHAEPAKAKVDQRGIAVRQAQKKSAARGASH